MTRAAHTVAQVAACLRRQRRPLHADHPLCSYPSIVHSGSCVDLVWSSGPWDSQGCQTFKSSRGMLPRCANAAGAIPGYVCTMNLSFWWFSIAISRQRRMSLSTWSPSLELAGHSSHVFGPSSHNNFARPECLSRNRWARHLIEKGKGPVHGSHKGFQVGQSKFTQPSDAAEVHEAKAG